MSDSGMKFSILLKTSVFRGDHAADVFIAYEYKDGETVTDMVKRVGLTDNNDVVEIRLMQAVMEPTQ